MATQTYTFAEFDSGAVRVEFDVNTANWRPSKVRCINNSTKAAVATVYENGVQVFVATAPGEQTSSWNITGVQLGWDSVDGGLIMGPYTVNVRWPA